MTAPAFDESEVALTRLPAGEARWLPARAYTSPEIWEEERAGFLSHVWLGLFHASSLPSPGDYRTINVLGQPLLIVRGPDQQVRAFLNICRHRGMAVADGRGNCDTFRCPYHTWRYDLVGRLLKAPLMAPEQMAGIDGLVPVRLETWLGFVFVNFDAAAPQLQQLTSPVGADLAPWHGEDLAVVYEENFDCPWNWKLTVENGIEGYHLLGTHARSVNDALPADQAYVTSGNGCSILHMPYGDESPDSGYPGSLPLLDGLPQWSRDEHRYYMFWPNFTVSCAPDGLYAYIRVPNGGSDHTTTWTMVASPTARESDDYQKLAADQVSFAQRIFAEDAYPCRTIQQNIRYGGWIPGPYHAAEKACWDFHQWYLNHMQGCSGTAA
jgi:phenylpropionate dioxygenase-like ring-hydroxylating dioxygenase large terminal subunit